VQGAEALAWLWVRRLLTPASGAAASGPVVGRGKGVEGLAAAPPFAARFPGGILAGARPAQRGLEPL